METMEMNGQPKQEDAHSSSSSPNQQSEEDVPIYRRLRNARPDLEIVTVTTIDEESGEEHERAMQVSVRREGFNKGFEPLQIVSVTRCGSMTFMVVQFKETDNLDIIPSTEALERCPKLVLGFFEQYVPYMPLTKPDVHLPVQHGGNATTTPSAPQCHACNARIVNISDKFCRNCGVRILFECLQCKAHISPSDHFCPQCGARRPMSWRIALLYGEIRRNPFAVCTIAGILGAGWALMYMKLRKYL